LVVVRAGAARIVVVEHVRLRSLARRSTQGALVELHAFVVHLDRLGQLLWPKANDEPSRSLSGT
jgi:hypothetical protein